MIPRPAPVRVKTDPLPQSSPRANLLSARGNSLISQSPISRVSSASGSPRLETSVNGVRKLPSIGDFVAVGSSRPSSSRARSFLSVNTLSREGSCGSVDFEEEGLITPTSLLRNKSKLSPLSRQQFESMLSISPDSKPPSPEANAVRAPEVAPPVTTTLQIFKIAEDSDEKAEAVVVPPGAEEKAGYHIPDESSLSDLDEAEEKEDTAPAKRAEQKSNVLKLPTLVNPRSGEEKSSSSIPYHAHTLGVDGKRSRGSPPLVNLHSSDSKSPNKGSPPIPVLHKKASPPGSKLLPSLVPQHDAPVRSPSLLLTERSLTPERGESERNASMRRSQSHA